MSGEEGSSYSFKNLLTQSPEKLKNTILAVVGVAAAVRGWDPSLFETLGVGLALEKVLDVFYVTPIRKVEATNNALVAFENVKLKSQRRPIQAD